MKKGCCNRQWMGMGIVIFLAIVVFTSSCGGAEVSTKGEMTIVSGGGVTWRTIDTEAGVVCWYRSKALSCLPIDQTKLENER